MHDFLLWIKEPLGGGHENLGFYFPLLFDWSAIFYLIFAKYTSSRNADLFLLLLCTPMLLEHRELVQSWARHGGLGERHRIRLGVHASSILAAGDSI